MIKTQVQLNDFILMTRTYRLASIIITLLLGLVILTYYVLFTIDASSASLSPITTPDAFNKSRNQNSPVILISYADGPQVFYKNQNSLCQSASRIGFSRIYNYRRSDIDDSFYQKNKHILEQKRGAGYWLWKPYVIYKTLMEAPENAVIVYADSGLIFKGSIKPLLDKLEKHDMLLVSHGKSTPIKTHLKREAYQVYGFPLTDKILGSENIWGFFIIVKNTSKTRDFIKKWLDLCQNPDALTDKPFTPSEQDADFSYHQHDQSLLGPLVAQYPEGILIIRRNELRKKFNVFNFHRHSEQEWTSPLWIQAGFPKLVSDAFWNNWLFQFIREKQNKKADF